MLKNFMLIGLLSLSTLTLFGTEANARVCLLSQGGSCLYYSGSVECDLSATGVGSIKNDPKSLGCNINATGTGLLLCKSPGGNLSPGVQTITVPQTFGASTGITSVDKNGKASATAIASADLTSLNQFCPNANWVASDYVPCSATITAQLSDQDGTLSSATFSCTLPSCTTLGFDRVSGKFERRQYDCTQQ